MPSWHCSRISRAPSAADRARATSVLPTPASPSSSSGDCSTTARLTASASGRSARYPWVAIAAPADCTESISVGAGLTASSGGITSGTISSACSQPRPLAGGVLKRATAHHPCQVALVIRARVEVGGWVGPVRRQLGRLGDVLRRELLAPQRILDRGRPQRNRGHVGQPHSHVLAGLPRPLD